MKRRIAAIGLLAVLIVPPAQAGPIGWVVHAGEGILACTCTAFELPDPMPMDGPTRFPEGAEI